jgi:translin
MLTGIEQIGEQIRAELDRQDAAREQAYTLSRQVVRAASMSIKSIHRREHEEARARLAECRRLTAEMLGALAETPGLRYGGFVGDAEKELVEAAITIACIEGEAPPGPTELGVDGAAWLNGLSEAGGEFRRHVLDLIRESNLDDAERFLTAMEEAYFALMGFDYPSAIDRGLRGRCDNLRGMVERTRGDLTNALRQARLEQRLGELETRMEGN